MRKFLPWIAIIFWMVVIFKLSSQPAVQSGELSGMITNINIKIIEKIRPNTQLNIIKFHRIVRKNAHFFIYLGLGVLTINFLKRRGVKGYKSIIFALLICILYAISDEVHQIFVPGRAAQVKDVIIDSAGACFGILLYIGLGKIKKWKKIRHGHSSINDNTNI
ncbi:VanZ family protein [Clostridium sp. MSJ-11]|uniref:VanZ family protein n=1 Tax=Clostridium mobile TaxID=2841512 RepID=A0ABS6EL29_9CLOT|nr:VanZ family protein [Clostridium mobile]MBU5485758.1 VanZ family protein [Clostridium mobile]